MINDRDGSKQRPEPYSLSSIQTASGSSLHSNKSVTAKSVDSRNDAGLIAAAAHVAVPTWANMVLMVSLIFGGCCANVSV